jgi:hypothetical protein
MNKSAIRFEVLREDGKVSGFSLRASGETEAEAFCYSFPSAVQTGRAEVNVEGRQIVFKHAGHRPDERTGNILLYSDGGEFAAEVEEDDADALAQLLDLQGPYVGRQLHCSKVQAWGRGFELKALAA